MPPLLSYRGRDVSQADADFITELIGRHPKASRRALSKLLCEAWDWRQANGAVRDMVCRGLMLELHRAGHIELPPTRCRPNNPLAHRALQTVPDLDQTLIESSLADLGPIEIEQVRRTPSESLVNGILEGHHYLGYTQPVGEHLKYLVSAGGRPIACMTWSSAPRHLGPRDRFIGWSPQARKRNISRLAYNSRFLILPWVRVPHLASHILGAIARRLPADWQQLYDHRVDYLETFIDPERFRGTCYKAANWIELGTTTGRGKDDLTHKSNRSLKQVMGYPLTKQFRKALMAIE